jgi:hypothetical protein
MRNIYYKLTVFHTLTIFSLCFFILYAFSIDDVLPYNDQNHYLLGYRLISTSNVFFEIFNDHFGSGTEIFLSVIYLLLGIFYVPENISDIIIVNNVLFTISMLFLCFVIFIKKNSLGLSSRYAITLIALVLAFMPLGVASQLSRQAITVVSLVSVVILFYRHISIYIAVPLLAVLSHVGSIFSLYPITVFLRGANLRVWFLTTLAVITLSYFLAVFFIEERFLHQFLIHPTLKLTVGDSYASIIYYPAILFNLLGAIFLIQHNNLKYLIVALNLLYFFYPIFFFTRVLWGIFFLFIPVVIFLCFIGARNVCQKNFYTKLVLIDVYSFALLIFKLGVVMWKI